MESSQDTNTGASGSRSTSATTAANTMAANTTTTSQSPQPSLRQGQEGDDGKVVTQTVKKKRTLSSYLSNVSSRKEELMRIAQREKEEAERKHREEERRKLKEQEEKRRREEEERKAQELYERQQREKQEREIQANIERKIREEQARQEREMEEKRLKLLQKQREREAELVSSLSIKTEKTETLDEIARSYDSIRSSKLFGSSLQYPFDSASSGYRMQDSGRTISRGVWQYIAPFKSFSRDLLKSLLKEPGLPNLLQEAEEYPSQNADLSRQEGDIESDAETVVVASPVRAKRGRLVRGDKLTSSQTNLSRELSMDNTSEDSELSNIEDDARRTPLWNIFLEEGHSSPSSSSSPPPPPPRVPGTGSSVSTHRRPESRRSSQPDVIKMNSSPDKKPETSPPHTPRTSHVAPPARRKSYIATTKPPKQRKSVYRDAGGRTKLQIACDKGQIDTVRRLLEEGEIDINDQDNAGNTSLHEAALNGHLDIVKLLVEQGANVNIQSYEMFLDTPLIDASANGHLDVIEYLLKNGADPTITNAKGMTAYEAIEDDSDLDESERELVKDIKSCLREYTKKWNRSHEGGGNSSGQRKPSVSRDRLSSETNEITDGGSAETKIYAAEDELQFIWSDIASKAGREKLVRAAKEGILSYVGNYLENGGKVDFKSFIEAVKFGHSEVVSLFLAFGAPVNGTTRDNVSPLMIAVGRDHLSTVKLLLEAGANVLLKDKNGFDALYYAKNSILGIETHAEIEMIKEAIAKATGKDISEVDSDRGTPVSAKTRESESGLLGRPSSIRISRERYRDDDKTPEVKDKVKHEDVHVYPGKGRPVGEEDEEEQIIIPSRRRTGSPAGIKRKRASTPIGTHGETKRARIARQNSVDSLDDRDSAKVAHDETPEEKEQRLRNTEEYLQRRLQTKKKKEQELLHKLQEGDRKREEERARQRVEEEKRELEARRQRELKETEERRENELARRRKVRELYPLGLKLIDFSDKTNIDDFLPLYYVVRGKSEERFVLDLQIIAILKDNDLVKGLDHTFDVDSKDKEQLWNVLKFIFLCGGRNNLMYEKAIQGSDLDTRIAYEAGEFNKFANLPMHWVRLDDIMIEDEHTKSALTSNMVEIALNGDQTTGGDDSKEERTSPLPGEQSSQYTTVSIPSKLQEENDGEDKFSCSIQPRWHSNPDNIWAMAPASEQLLPIKFRHRPCITGFLLGHNLRRAAQGGKDHFGRSAGKRIW